jgi:hypothetical protein
MSELTEYTKEKNCPRCGNLNRPVYNTPGYFWPCSCVKVQVIETKEPEKPAAKKRRDLAKTISMKQWLWTKKNVHNNTPKDWEITTRADYYIKRHAELLVKDLAAQLGYEVKLRSEISDWSRRRLPKLRMGEYTWYFRKTNKLKINKK